MTVATQDIIVIILGLYIGLLLSKHNILNWDKACLPFVGIKTVITKILNWGKKQNAKNNKENTDEAPKL
jgi:hypothetical protein